MGDKRVYLYDSMLRDGAQTQGIDFSAADKLAIAEELDRLGIDCVEGGWPGANLTDDAFFAEPPSFSHAKLTAFGMTRRAGRARKTIPGSPPCSAPRPMPFASSPRPGTSTWTWRWASRPPRTST